jgi:hypothetical protein
VNGGAIEQVTDEAPSARSIDDPTMPMSAYDAAGVDRSLIRWMLSLTPSERLRHVQGTIDLVHKAKRVPNGDR